MKISYNWLQNYFEKPLPTPEKLKDVFDFHSLEVESFDEVLDPSGKVTETIFDIKVLPDRAHFMLSHEGVAKDLSVLLNMSLKKEKIPPPPAPTIETAPRITIQDPQFCRRYIGQYVEGITVGDSPAWIQMYLEAVGGRSINSIVDATNITMFNIGQPLHAFDADKVKGDIVVRSAQEGEKMVLLDGTEVALKAGDYVVADDGGPLAIAGVKGGKRAEVSMSTTKIIIESANFDPTIVRRTSTRLNLRNESSKRFENEITPELAAQGMSDMMALVKELCRESQCGPVVDIYPTKPNQTVILLDPAYIEERLGVQIPEADIKNILERSGIVIGTSATPADENDVSTADRARSPLGQHEDAQQGGPAEANSLSSTGHGAVWSLTIPFKRLDLVIPEDIVEEVGRAYGLEHITGILPPKTEKPVEVLSTYYLAEKIKNILAGIGFSEVSLYALVAKGDIETSYPLARDKAFLRKNLADNMMVCVEKNALNADLIGLEAVKVFEIGHVFSKEGETISLSLGAAQVKKVKGYKSEQIIAEAIQALNDGLALNIIAPKNIVKGNYVVCEIDVSELVKSFMPSSSYSDLNFGSTSENRYKKISPYPFMVRDIAVFVSEDVQDSAVWAVVQQAISDAKADELLVRHALFDTFKKDGKVSYAFRLVFQSMERTLTDDEANGIMEKIYVGMKGKGWEVR